MTNDKIIKEGEKFVYVSKDNYYSLDDYKTKLNNNILVWGCSGSGKTRGFVKPNLLQAYGSYIVSDPKGNLYNEFKDYLQEKGYKTYLLDYKNPENSNSYNMFDYVDTEEDMRKIGMMLMESKGIKSEKEPYWSLSASEYITAIIALVKTKMPKEKQNIHTVAEIINTEMIPINSNEEYLKYRLCMNHLSGKYDDFLKIIIDDNKYTIDDERCEYYVEEPIRPVGLKSYFYYLKEEEPDSYAVKMYGQHFAESADSTRQCITMEAKTIVNDYCSKSLEKMVNSSDFKLEDIGKEKTAIFVSASDTDRSLDSLVNIFYTQCMNELCDFADNKCKNSRLPIDVRFILDDFATNCKINDFDKSIAMIRSRGISASILVQNLSQLNTCYEAGAKTICSNCDTWLYYGSNDFETAELMAKQVNMPTDMLFNAPLGQCYIYRRGEKPYKSFIIEYDEFKNSKRSKDKDATYNN